MSNSKNELWKNFVPEEKRFKIRDYELIIPANIDLFNDYRKYFSDFSKQLIKMAKSEYNDKVADYRSFVEEAIKIYYRYLDVTGEKAMDIMVSNGIYTVTKEEFIKKHVDNFHDAYDYYKEIAGKAEEKEEQKAKMASSLWNFMEPKTGGVIASKENYARAVRTAQMSNALNSFFGKIAIKHATKLTKGEQNILYKDINPSVFIGRMENDLKRAYWIVVDMLRKKIDIWMPDSNKSANANNILKNLSNPNFPKDQKMNAFKEIFLINPYNIDCINFLENECGVKEVQELKNYLGLSVSSKRFCPNCGIEVEDGTNFCADCGSPLE